jgi:class 3 adenylate cyclase/tetratricopeptide (TPR) repeat protein
MNLQAMALTDPTSPTPMTLLFTALANAAELLQQAGDEQAQRVFQAHHRLLKRLVDAHGGRDVKWLGDGFLTVFAVPADALRCAVALQLAARRRAASGRLDVRVGLHLGGAPREETDYFGTPVVIARLLCGAARAGQVLCSAPLGALLAAPQAFTCRDCGDLSLPGLAAPVPACEVVYRQDQPLALLTHTPFVGRAAELARLTAGLQDARAGCGGLVMLAGEPGIGKTRTLEEFAEIAHTDGALVLWGRCYEGEAARPYGPFVEALAEHARTARPESLRADLGLGAAPLARLVPVLRERLPDIPEPVALQPDEERVRLLDAVAQLLITLAARAPVVLVLDDLQWADAASVALLRHVARFAARNRLLVLGAYREVEVTPGQPLADALGTLPRETTYAHVAFSGLDSAEVEELLTAVADQQVQAALVAALTAETSGNPFFIREMLLHLVEEGKLVRRDGQWTPNLPIEEMGIPHGVRQVIQRRLARLSAPANRLLRAAAGFAGSFRFEIAARVAELDEAEALHAIDDAVAAQLLCTAGAVETFDFTHALVRHTLYAELNSPRQARLHRRIAEVMEQTHGDADEHAGEIARHYHQSASLPGAERGVAYCLVGAARAEQSAAFAEAAKYLRMALALSDPNDARRPRLLGRLALALIWNLALNEAEQAASDAAAAIAAAEGNDAAADFLADAADAMWVAAMTPRAWSLARCGLGYIGSRRDTTWARLMVYDIESREAADPEFPGMPVDSPQRREVMTRLWELPAFRHPTQKMFAYMAFQSREDVLRRAGDDPFALVFWAGEYQRALPLLEQATATAVEHGQIALATFYLTLTARVQLMRGDLASSKSTYARALELFDRVKEVPWLRVFVETARGNLLINTGEGWEHQLAGAQAVLREGAAENQYAMAGARCLAAYASACLGRSDEALAWLASVIPVIERAPPTTFAYPVLLGIAAATLEVIGRADHAETIERNLRAKWLQPDFRYVLAGESRWSLAMLCGLQGRFEEAAEWFAKARVVLQEQGARPFSARINFNEARMYLRRGAPGDRQRATTLLHAAVEQCRALGLTGWARLAEEMLASLNGPTDKAPAPAAELTENLSSGNPVAAIQEAQPVLPSGKAVFRREGDSWILAYEGLNARAKDVRGFSFIAQLLRDPGREFHAVDLVQGAGAKERGSGNSGAPSLRQGGLEILDQPAKAAYRRRLVDLRAELNEAEEFNDAGRAERARAEIEVLTGQLTAAVGLGGRPRVTGSAAERARSTVTQRIKQALKKIAAVHRVLGEHLALRIKTGTYCVYLPDTAQPIVWEVSAGSDEPQTARL